MSRYTLMFLTALPSLLAAQQGGTPPRLAPRTVGDTSIFAPLQLPTPNEFRSGSGKPGAKYWQNKADYDIAATLDTAAKTLHGKMTLRYTNNSPDTLDYIWLQTEQNAFRPNSLNSMVFSQDSRFGGRGFAGGDVIERMEQVVGVAPAPLKRSKLVSHDNETMTRVDLAQPLAPGRVATIEIDWHFLIPEHGADRMGRDGPLFELAQWYPRLAVYDDIRGWNTDPYLGQGEFYLEYGNFNLAITLPAGYIVAATGALQNPLEVLTATEIARLATAAKSDKPVRIITNDELKNGTARARTTGTMTWKFAAKNVRDAVWAASPEYQWDASSYKGIMAFAYYRHSADSNWSDAADQARMSIMEYSERWYQYPWPHISAVEGPISGMEYPMLAMEDKSADVFGLYNVVTHEIGHSWFPMMVGSNERMYMWQDEGFNTFINLFSEARRYPAKGDQMARAAEERGIIEKLNASGRDLPIMIAPDRVNPDFLGYFDYYKPSVGLQMLRQEILGPEMFDLAFKTYIKRWVFKHPTPADFFRTMEDAAGHRLDWFWREWFLENARFDQAVESVQSRQVGDSTAVIVVYGNRERGVLPIHARFTFTDGSTQSFTYPAEVWSTNSTVYSRRYTFAKPIAKLELDPDKLLVDIDRTNNVWEKK